MWTGGTAAVHCRRNQLGALVATIVAAALLSAGAASGAAPPGATAHCRDGTYSESQHRSGTCSHHGGVADWLGALATGEAAAPATEAAPATAGMVEVGRTVLLAPRVAQHGCRRGALPDRRCSPGAYSAGLTKEVLCSPGFRTGTIRNVPQAEKSAIEREYGMPARLYGRTIEIDHIVSLELGGSNNPANLYPEPGTGPASYHVKDRLENRLHALVCSGRIPLRAAQRRIAANWESLYRSVFGVAPVAAG